MIKQVPTYEKNFKDLCTVKRGLGIENKAFLTEQVSAIIQSKTPMKYKDPGSPTISVNIGGTCIDKAMLDLGASVNLLPYSVYKQLGLGELKPTNITLSLADRSVKIPKGIVEDVLVKVDKFYYPVDFVVLDTEPIAIGPNHVPIILGRPFLATSNAIINCRNGVMQLTFGNMTLELNIFHLSNKHKPAEDERQEFDVAVDPPRGEHPVPEVEVERTTVPDSSPPVPPPTAPAPTDTAGPSYTAQQSPEHIHVSSRELAAVMDVVCTLATTRASLYERMARAEVTLTQNHAMLLRIMSHLGLPPVSVTEPTQPTTREQSAVSAAATSLDMLAATAAASDPPASTPSRE